jgi:alpha-1,3-rhamnosyl/mannosyltransferase
MHVTVNLQPLLTPLTGIGHYTRELTLQLLAGSDDDPPMELYGLTGNLCEPLSLSRPLLTHPEAPAAGSHPLDERGPLWQFARCYLRNPLTRKAYRWLSSYRLQRHVRQMATPPDSLYWEPNYILLPWQGPSVLTVHDLSHQRHPEFHPPERVDFFNRHLPESLARATRINVVSQFTASELTALHGVDPARIDLVPPGVGAGFFTPPEPTQISALKDRYHLPAAYLLSVATLEPRKNLERVMQAFAELPLPDQHASPLLLVGQSGWGERRWNTAIQHALEAGTIRLLGYVPAADLPGLYALASGLGYVSHYEGFGMPVIEAMASGTPVLTSNVTATLEVAGNAAITVDPRDTSAIRRGLQALMQDDHGDRVSLGRERAAGFSWPASARALRRSLRQAMETA